MTITEKIIAAHCERDSVRPGEIVQAKVDIALANDITAPLAIEAFSSLGAGEVFDRNKVVLVMDHFTPAKDIKSAQQCKFCRDFARKHGIVNFFDVGEVGIEHVLLPEKGIVLPGDIVIGADSHTCTYGALGAFSTGVGSTDLAAVMATGEIWLRVPETIKFIYKGKLRKWVSGKDLILFTIGRIGVDGATYKAMEFTGEVIAGLPMSGRFTMCNMAIEAGGKNGIVEPDDITEEYVKERAKREYSVYHSDDDAEYSDVMEFDVSDLEPQVAFPSLPSNSRPVSEAGDVPIDQVVIGSCTNGSLDDLRVAAAVLSRKKKAKYVRLIVIPGTQEIYRKAMSEGLFEQMIDAGAVISPPTCGPCLGGHMGILAEGERAVATTNRNFVGRMGHLESEVYLAGPAVAAASAVAGRIASPEEI
ncbi:MAG: 3-isopropylmalate dehydratase large subunit [Candidatus Tritonobacter lacicola]|nr:3-isopropylmalate dehydratase large subunit [Candidatus Tritonobacter lacicola]